MNPEQIAFLANLGVGGGIALYIVGTTNKKIDTLIDAVQKLTEAVRSSIKP